MLLAPTMDFLKKKMKELLDDDDKKEEKKDDKKDKPSGMLGHRLDFGFRSSPRRVAKCSSQRPA